MAELYQEYLRRNLLVAKAVGVKANTSHALKRLEQQARPPQWLVNALRVILERADPLPGDLARWRDTAPDAPDYVRAEMETAADDAPKSFTDTDGAIDFQPVAESNETPLCDHEGQQFVNADGTCLICGDSV